MKRKRPWRFLFTFSVLHHNGGVLQEGDEKVACLQVGIQRQFWVVHHYTANIHIKSHWHIITADTILRKVLCNHYGEGAHVHKWNRKKKIYCNLYSVAWPIWDFWDWQWYAFKRGNFTSYGYCGWYNESLSWNFKKVIFYMNCWPNLHQYDCAKALRRMLSKTNNLKNL